jgi:diaminopimelate decarboxylase
MNGSASDYPIANDAGLQLTFALDKIRDSFEEDDDPQTMFNAIVALLKERFQASACAIVLLAETNDDVEAIAASGLSQGEALDLCREAMRRDTLTTIENPYWRYTIGNRIILKGLPLGGLALARQDSPFTPAEMKLMEIAEKQVDSAIVQARMIWKLAQRNRELAGIYAVDRLRDQISDEDTLITSFAETLVEQFQADLVMICEQQPERLITRALLDSRSVEPAVLDNLRSYTHDLEFPQVIPVPTGHHRLVVLAAPFIINHDRVGAVIIGRDALFTVGDHRLLYALTSQIDSAMVHLRLAKERGQSTVSHVPVLVQTSAIAEAPFNDSIQYRNGTLYCDDCAVQEIAAQVGTPTYVYSLHRVLANYTRIKTAFPQADIHYSAKANNHRPILETLIHAGTGIDAVSAGEIHMTRRAGAKSQDIVFAGVGKTMGELYYAVSRGVAWFNIENVEEASALNAIAGELQTTVRVAPRFNPEVTANTHSHIATGHRYAKFGLSAEAISYLLNDRDRLPNLRFEGLHIHIGSQLGDTMATRQAVQIALDLIAPYPFIRTLNIGGGFPATYLASESIPAPDDFASVILPLTKDYALILEPGRSLVADAGMLLMRVQYIKRQGGKTFVILDGGMTELIRPMLYEAQHVVVPVTPRVGEAELVTLVGPVCESTDILAADVLLPPLEVGDVLAVLTAGAYGMVMSSNYNARLRPAEVVVLPNGDEWRLSRRRETWEDLVRCEVD